MHTAFTHKLWAQSCTLELYAYGLTMSLGLSPFFPGLWDQHTLWTQGWVLLQGQPEASAVSQQDFQHELDTLVIFHPLSLGPYLQVLGMDHLLPSNSLGKPSFPYYSGLCKPPGAEWPAPRIQHKQVFWRSGIKRMSVVCILRREANHTGVHEIFKSGLVW